MSEREGLHQFLTQKTKQLTEEWYEGLEKKPSSGVYGSADEKEIAALKQQNHEFHVEFCQLFAPENRAGVSHFDSWIQKIAKDENHLSTSPHFILREFCRTRDQYLRLIQLYAAEQPDCQEQTVAEWNRLVIEAVDNVMVWFMEKHHEYAVSRLKNQQEIISELSAPVIALNPTTGLLPLVGDIDTMRAKHILEKTLQQCAEKNIDKLFVDLSGVVAIDTMVAQQIFQLHDALKLIGVETTLSGIRPEIAQTAVQLGLSFDNIPVSATLQRALNYI